MRDAIHALKYQGLATAARPLGRLLAKAIEQLPPGNPASDSTRESGLLVVPVPLHRAKSGQRGFNQARLLAESAIRALRISRPGWRLTLAPNSVIRLRATGSQAGLSPHQRRRNVRGAFSVPDPRAITGRHVLLIDDIFTTGATARAVARALRSAGAASVSVATLARARLLQHTLKPQPASAVTSAAHTPTASMHASTNQPSF
jgi:ComF family protein